MPVAGSACRSPLFFCAGLVAERGCGHGSGLASAMSFFPRNPLSEDAAKTTANALQPALVCLVDLALKAKQAHWNVFGTQFLSVHEKLDDVVESARKGSDTLAERMVQIGFPADARASTVAAGGVEPDLPESFQNVPSTLKQMSDVLLAVSHRLRESIETVGDVDPLTEDQLIAIGQEIEEHLWMLQAMEKDNAATA